MRIGETVRRRHVAKETKDGRREVSGTAEAARGNAEIKAILHLVARLKPHLSGLRNSGEELRAAHEIGSQSEIVGSRLTELGEDLAVYCDLIEELLATVVASYDEAGVLSAMAVLDGIRDSASELEPDAPQPAGLILTSIVDGVYAALKQLATLLKLLATPKEWILKGQIGVPPLVGSSIEIRFGK